MSAYVNKTVERKYDRAHRSVYHRGEILFARVTGGEGSEQDGDRYCVVIQNDKGNTYSPTIIVAMITSSTEKKELPVHVPIDGPFYGMEKESVILLEQLRTLDKKRIYNRCGKLDELTLRKLDKALVRSVFNVEDELIFEQLLPNVRKYIFNKLNFIDQCNITLNLNRLLGASEGEINRLEMLRKDENEGLMVYCVRNHLDFESVIKAFYALKDKELNRVMND